ncbi:MAG: alpha/beta hydrolase [Anaerolineae bacterium]
MPDAIDTLIQEKRYFTHDGQRIAYLTTDDGGEAADRPVLLMVHGWLSHAGIWKWTMDSLRDQYRCAAIDLLGHGHSDKPPKGDYRIAAQAARVLALADALGVKKFGVVGHSMGGQIALYLAIHYPDRIERVVSVSGVANGRLSGYLRRVVSPIFWLGAVFPPVWAISRRMVNVAWYRAIFDYALYDNFRAIPADSLDRRMALIKGIEIPAWRDLQAIAAVDLTPDLPRITAPVGVLFGCRDRTVPIENGRLVAEKVPGARMITLDECGHAPMTEQPKAYLAALRTLLSGVPT